ncbi:MAG: GNAT family N-acetyltransferase [Rhodospirillaceae bacterium]|nr:GNAT family N-acetyltransferase [Rhodospirillaceae bacterium]
MNFLPYDIDDFDEVLSLLQAAFEDTKQSQNFEELGKTPGVGHYNRFVVKENGIVIAYLAYCTRIINHLGIKFAAASIGPVAVKPDAQGKGVGKFLMNSVIEHLSSKNFEFIYIQGIPHYYQSFGFTKYVDKIKRVVVVAKSDQKNAGTSVERNCSDAEVYRSLYESYTRGVCFAAARSIEDWLWLINDASNTYYFYEPRVIRDKNGIAVCYFCDDPYVPESPREIVFRNDEVSIEAALSALGSYYAEKGHDTFELKIPDNSVVASIVDIEPNKRLVHNNTHGGDLLLITDEFDAAVKLAPSLQSLVTKIDHSFEATAKFKGFSIHFGNDADKPFVSVSKGPDASTLAFVEFISGRLSSDDCKSIESIPPNQYENIQNLLFGRLMKFVFQGDNM